MEELKGHRQIKGLSEGKSSIKILQLTDMHVWWPSDGTKVTWETKGRTVEINAEGSPYSTSKEPELIEAIVRPAPHKSATSGESHPR